MKPWTFGDTSWHEGTSEIRRCAAQFGLLLLRRESDNVRRDEDLAKAAEALCAAIACRRTGFCRMVSYATQLFLKQLAESRGLEGEWKRLERKEENAAIEEHHEHFTNASDQAWHDALDGDTSLYALADLLLVTAWAVHLEWEALPEEVRQERLNDESPHHSGR